MTIQMIVCGSRGSFPTYGDRYSVFGYDTSCYAFRCGSRGLIIDCGSGLGRACGELKGCESIDILLSHVHYDHIMGLFDCRQFFETKKTVIYGNFESWQAEEKESGSLFSLMQLLPGEKKQVKNGERYLLNSGFSVRFFPSNHGDQTSMIEVSAGNARLFYTGDYEAGEDTAPFRHAENCDLFLFDGSYSPEDYPKYKGWGHSGWDRGAEIAEKYHVKKLVITHHAPQYDDESLLMQEKRIKTLFAPAVFARQNDVYEL